MMTKASPFDLLLMCVSALPLTSPFVIKPVGFTIRDSSMVSITMTKKVFIDGEVGTTGLQVRERLSGRTDLEIISPPNELRKDPETRKKFINEADAVILCKYFIIHETDVQYKFRS